ncbi:MAG: NAD-dependent epimerase/dehydratase family protein [Sandaracinaceae bacterium]
MRILVTGSTGLIGAEAVMHFCALGHDVVGVDNNQRAVFFGPDGDTSAVRQRLIQTQPRYRHADADIRDRAGMLALFEEVRPGAVVHCAAQPSHDLAAKLPFADFDTNAVGTLNLLEATRQHTPEAPFVFMSTNKVYGDAPNRIARVELPTRYEFDDPRYADGIDESLSIDQCLHSLFGASKVAADVMCQEYGRYFGMPVGVFRGGCLTGAQHAGAEQHGFLAYLVRAVAEGRRYTVYGYDGKQVRDQIHAHDVVRAFEAFIEAPRAGEVYNLGGGKDNSVSMQEAIDQAEQRLGKTLERRYSETNRVGDHVVYYSDLSKVRAHFPGWSVTRSLDDIFEDLVRAVSAG